MLLLSIYFLVTWSNVCQSISTRSDTRCHLPLTKLIRCLSLLVTDRPSPVLIAAYGLAPQLWGQLRFRKMSFGKLISNSNFLWTLRAAVKNRIKCASEAQQIRRANARVNWLPMGNPLHHPTPNLTLALHLSISVSRWPLSVVRYQCWPKGSIFVH